MKINFNCDRMVKVKNMNTGEERELDVKSIIFMKEEAGKRFSLNPDDVPTIALEKESYDIRVENTRLKEENEILRQKMDALLTFIKDHKDTNTADKSAELQSPEVSISEPEESAPSAQTDEPELNITLKPFAPEQESTQPESES